MYAEESLGQVALAEQIVLEPIVPLPPGLDVMQTDVIVVVVEIDIIHPVFGDAEPAPEPEPTGDVVGYAGNSVGYGGDEVGY